MIQTNCSEFSCVVKTNDLPQKYVFYIIEKWKSHTNLEIDEDKTVFRDAKDNSDTSYEISEYLKEKGIKSGVVFQYGQEI